MKPILFNTERVRAILADRKTVTRRVMKPQPIEKKSLNGISYFFWAGKEYMNNSIGRYGPYRLGDILYVRETWTIFDGDYEYKADVDDGYGPFCSNCTLDICAGDCNSVLKWRPSIHMPREAARLFLRVTNVWVERLQDITEDQAVREGVYRSREDYGIAIYAFSDVWNRAIKPADRALYSWDANPWVWVIEFERICRDNIPMEE